MPDEKKPPCAPSTAESEHGGSDEKAHEPKPEGQYYYDDGHGYQEFDPNSADDGDEK